MKYYLKRNAGRPLEIDGEFFKFTPCENVANTWIGVYSTDNEKEIGLLDRAAEQQLIIEVDEATYTARLRRRTKERIEATKVSSPSEYQPHAKRVEEAKPAEVESVKDVSEDDMNATAAKEPADSGKAYIKKLPDLALELGITEPELEELRAREGAPARTGKGYHVRSFQEFLAGVSKPDQPTD